jgi:uncharacterized repeat protein (TIGR03803 family)
LYGLTVEGGDQCAGGQGCGTVFTVDPTTGAETTIYSFTGGADGDNPGSLHYWAGAFYGSALFGAGTGCGGEGCNTLFKIDPATDDLTVLYTFTGGADGSTPYDLRRQSRIFYGNQPNAVFSFDPGTGVAKVLDNFSNPADGTFPSSVPLMVHEALYGATIQGGGFAVDCPETLLKRNGCGVIYKLNPKTGAAKVLYAFDGADGANPSGPMIYVNGAFYGVTSNGGSGKCKYGCGTVFKFVP